jgi:predicted transcriptional regulator
MATKCSHIPVWKFDEVFGVLRMSEERPRNRDLSPAQQRIMECIWEYGELSASGVRTILARHQKVARNTVRTLLERMEDKGWLKHREVNRTYLYSATKPKQTTVGEKVRDAVDQICGGSPEALMAALIDYRGLTKGELSRIRQMLDEAKSRKSTKLGD